MSYIYIKKTFTYQNHQFTSGIWVVEDWFADQTDIWIEEKRAREATQDEIDAFEAEQAIWTDGNTILYGTAEPTTEGNNGDFYIRTSTNYIYGPKVGGVWPAGVPIVGPPGATGPQGEKGDKGDAGDSGGTSYLTYVALLSQYGAAAPVAVVQQNTLGGDIEWTRVSTGFYNGTLIGGMPLGRTFVSIAPQTGPCDSDSVTFIGAEHQEEDVVSVYTARGYFVGTTENVEDGILGGFNGNGTSIEIRVYPA